MSSLTEFFRGMKHSLESECERLKTFSHSIQRTSTEIEFQASVANSIKSSSTSSLSSAREFSSDNEKSDSDDDDNKLKHKQTMHNSFKNLKKNSDLEQTKTNEIKQTEVANFEKVLPIPKKRSSYSHSESHHELNNKNLTQSKLFLHNKKKSETEPTSVTLSFRTDLFIKFFFIL